METDKKTIYKLAKRLLGLDGEVVRMQGFGPVAVQLANLAGMESVTRCDADSGDTSQYYGDLLKDIHVEGGEI